MVLHLDSGIELSQGLPSTALVQNKVRLDELRPYWQSHFAQRGVKLDAADTAMFLRSLTYVIKELYEIEYPDLKFRQIIPLDTQVDPGAEYFAYRQMDRQGQAKIIQANSSDMPRVVASGREYMNRVLSMGISYSYTLQEVRAASLSGVPLPDLLAKAARLAIEELYERLAAVGTNGLAGTPALESADILPSYGITNFPGASNLTTTLNWTASGTTVQQIMADVVTAQKKMYDVTVGRKTPKTLVLPTAIYSYLATTPRSTTFTDDTMLQYIQKASPWLKRIVDWAQLNTAGKLQDGSTTGPRILFLDDDRSNFSAVIPQPFEQLPPQPIDLRFDIPCHARWGGLKVLQPLSIVTLDGATG